MGAGREGVDAGGGGRREQTLGSEGVEVEVDTGEGGTDALVLVDLLNALSPPPQPPEISPRIFTRAQGV